MKKVFFLGIAAATMLASCSKDETVDVPQGKAIGFSNTFVDNATRSVVDPSFTVGTLGNFAVYGFTQNGQIFDGELFQVQIMVAHGHTIRYSIGWKETNIPSLPLLRHPFLSVAQHGLVPA